MDATVLNRRFRLVKGAYLRRVGELPFDVRSRIYADDEDYVLLLPTMRARARLISRDFQTALQFLTGQHTLVEAIRLAMAELGHLSEAEADALCIRLLELLEDGLLVEVGTDTETRSRFCLEAGSAVLGYQILAPLQQIGETELYTVGAATGETGILKLETGQHGAQIEKIGREVRFLGRLAGLPVPKILQHGRFLGYEFLIMERISGRSVAQLVGERALERCSMAARLKIALRLLRAYAAIHSKGVLHGDVHPENVLIGAGTRPYVIDFGDASFTHETRVRQSGVERFLEPEYYRGLCSGDPSLITEAGEQYSVSALAYEIICGFPYLDFSLRAESVRSQIVREAPIPFSARGIYGLSEIEHVVRKGLSKEPESRFASMAQYVSEFAEALTKVLKRRRTEAKRARSASPHVPQHHAALRTFLRDADVGGILEQSIGTQPLCSAHHGAAGIAIAVARISETTGSPIALALSDLWVRRADAWSSLPNAYWTDWMSGARPPDIESSLHFGSLGVWYAGAIVGRLSGTNVGASLIHDLGRLPRPSSAELALGKGGWLLALSLAHECYRSAGVPHDPRIVEYVKSLNDGIYNNKKLPVANLLRTGIFTGMAHGVCGTVYCSALATRQVLGLPKTCTPDLQGAIETLVEAAQTTDFRRNLYSRILGSNSQWTGWCGGLAGYIQFWSAMYALDDTPLYLELALKAEHLLRTKPDLDHNGTLCCGRIGIAYAYLSLFRATAQVRFLHEAQSLARDIRGLVLPSLFKGYVGYARLLADLEDPISSRMPFVEECLP